MNENELTHAIAREHVNLASGLLSMMVPQSAGTGVGLKGLDGRYQIVNPILETLAGLSVGAMTGKTDLELFAPDIAARLGEPRQLHEKVCGVHCVRYGLSCGNHPSFTLRMGGARHFSAGIGLFKGVLSV